MSERRPAAPDPRASLVDSGWSEPAPAEERALPSYDEGGREHLITRVDDEIQARIAAMNYDERADVTVTTGPAPARRLPPPPPPPLPVPQLPPPPAPPQVPLAELSAALLDERTLVDAKALPVSSAPPSRPLSSPPPPLRPISTPPSRPVSLPPPLPLPRPSFAPMHSTDAVFIPPPPLREALADRVRLGSVELPLWGVLVPVFLLTVLLVALIAGAAAAPSKEARAPLAAPSVAADSAVTTPAVPSSPQPSEAAPSGDARSGSLVERATNGDEKALAVIEHRRPQDRSSDEALALATGKVALELSAVGKLRARLASDPGLAKDPKIIADLRRMAQDPDTSRDALAAMAALPGALSADLLYESWTSTAERSVTTELAQALLMGRDVRPKASPALAVALDLRDAESCEDNAKLLQRAIEVGDKRAFAPLSRLLRRNGCGASKRDDCYSCIREGDQLKNALNAVKMRREPELVRRDTR